MPAILGDCTVSCIPDSKNTNSSIYLNGTSIPCNVQVTLLSLLNREKIPLQGIAVAVNETILPRGRWHDTFLHPGDEVLVVTATQGG